MTTKNLIQNVNLLNSVQSVNLIAKSAAVIAADPDDLSNTNKNLAVLATAVAAAQAAMANPPVAPATT